MNTVAERHLTDDQLLRVPAVAEILATSEGFVWGLIRQGVLPSVKISRCRRIPAGALKRVIQDRLAQRGTEATTAARGH